MVRYRTSIGVMVLVWITESHLKWIKVKQWLVRVLKVMLSGQQSVDSVWVTTRRVIETYVAASQRAGEKMFNFVWISLRGQLNCTKNLCRQTAGQLARNWVISQHRIYFNAWVGIQLMDRQWTKPQHKTILTFCAHYKKYSVFLYTLTGAFVGFLQEVYSHIICTMEPFCGNVCIMWCVLC